MTKISQLSSIGDSLAVNDQFLIRDVDDATTPNKSVTVSGITRALDVGNATAPAIAFASDKNTGIYSPGADQVAISTNGTQRLLIKDASQDTLRVSGVNAVVTADAIGSSYPGFRLASNGSILAGFDGDSGNSASLFTYGAQPLIFGTDSAERLRITSAGLVGVGTSSPSATLEVNGTLTTQGNILASSGGATRTITLGNAGAGLEYNVDGTTYLGGRTDGFPLVFRTSNTERLRITSAGLVGIGTAIPSVRLQIQDSIAGGSGGTIATLHNFSDTGGDTRYTGLNFVIGSDNGTSAIRAARTLSAVDYRTDLSFWTNPTGATQTPVRAMTIDYLQRVGIGTASPGAKLTVVDTAALVAAFGRTGSAGSQIALTDSTSSTGIGCSSGALTFGANGYETERARIDSSGRLLVGTSTARTNFSIAGTSYAPQTQLEGGVLQASFVRAVSPYIGLAASNTAADGTSTGNISFFGNDGTNLIRTAEITSTVDGTPGTNDMPGRLVFSTTADGASSPTERLRITSAGLVGIGTSSPGTILEIGESGGPQLTLRNTNSSTSGVVDGTTLATIGFAGTDSAPLGEPSVAASIRGVGEAAWTGTTSTHKAGLAFLTQADSSVGKLERMRITNTGNVGIGTTSPQRILNLSNDGATHQLAFNDTDLGATGAWWLTGNVNGEYKISQSTNASGLLTTIQDRLIIDTSGRLLVGTSSARTNFYSGAPTFQVEGVSTAASQASIICNTLNSNFPRFNLAKTRNNNTTSGATAVIADDGLGSVDFSGADGTNFIRGAAITAYVDGTPGANDMPGRLVFSTTADGASSPTERMRISSSGVLTHTGGTSTTGGLVAEIKGSGTGLGLLVYEGNNNGAANAANSTVKVGQTTATARSISAAGTINASGADYAEYMVKVGDFTIAKGDICGVTSAGLLTNEYNSAVSFVVKSTSPSYVGGDNWGAGFDDDPDGLEAVRQTVDRIAFAGQVPVNVMGATPGQYIVPVEAADGGIIGIAKGEAELTLAEYMQAVGKVIAIEDDGRARIIVKVA